MDGSGAASLTISYRVGVRGMMSLAMYAQLNDIQLYAHDMKCLLCGFAVCDGPFF